ncbi:MAG TPA: radical SAM protein [Rhizomicrobium sp.]|nr:radical SAM protein [Rhizomicrobium sp.]
MTVELRPLGVLCNLACEYCYQNPQREAKNVAHRYDIERMKSAVEAEGGPFNLFGGEPLLLPLRDLETLWAWGLERYGRNGVQTNGTTIRSAHIDLFKRYKVHVGISIDGPGEMNALRVAHSRSPEATVKATAKAERAIEQLCEAGIVPGLIVTLHRTNASPAVIGRLHDWFRRLDALGLRSVGLHVLESESDAIRQAHGLSMAENIEAFLGLYELGKSFANIRFQLFDEMRALLMGKDDKASCVWTACDPYTTRAVRGIEGNGRRSNCGRTNKDGIDFVKSASSGYERYISLYFSAQEDGGCAGCRFFLMCKGNCPGTAINGDWRNRTEFCELWKALFVRFEDEIRREGRTPLSLGPERTALEQRMVAEWCGGRNPSLAEAMAQL